MLPKKALLRIAETELNPRTGLPKRLRLENWDKDDGDIDPLVLLNLAVAFYTDYRDAAQRMIAEHSTLSNISPASFAIPWQDEMDLSRPEMDELWRFIVAVGLLPEDERLSWKRMYRTWRIEREDLINQIW